jgi:hypothetical protein
MKAAHGAAGWSSSAFRLHVAHRGLGMRRIFFVLLAGISTPAGPTSKPVLHLRPPTWSSARGSRRLPTPPDAARRDPGPGPHHCGLQRQPANVRQQATRIPLLERAARRDVVADSTDRRHEGTKPRNRLAKTQGLRVSSFRGRRATLASRWPRLEVRTSIVRVGESGDRTRDSGGLGTRCGAQ